MGKTGWRLDYTKQSAEESKQAIGKTKTTKIDAMKVAPKLCSLPTQQHKEANSWQTETPTNSTFENEQDW